MGETTGRSDDKRRWKKIKITGEEDSLDSTLPGNCLDGQMESTAVSTGKG